MMVTATSKKLDRLVEHWVSVHDANLENVEMSEGTLRKYHKLLEKLIRGIGKPLDELSEPEVFTWIKAQNWSPRVMKQGAIDLNKVFERCRVLLSDTTDPRRIGRIRKIKAKAKDKIDPAKLTNAREMPEVIAVVDDLVLKGAVALLYELGCRADELLSLRVKDWRPDSTKAFSNVWVHKSKTDKRMVVSYWSFPFVTQALIGRDLSDKEAPLFINRKGKALKYTQLNETVKRATQKALGKELTCHMFRKSRISEWVREGATGAEIQKWAGWKDLQMMKIYDSQSAEQANKMQLEHMGLLNGEEGQRAIVVKKCGKCNEPVSEGLNFCGKCGLAVSTSAQLLISHKNGFIGTRTENDMQAEIEGLKGVVNELVDTVKALVQGKGEERKAELAEKSKEFEEHMQKIEEGTGRVWTDEERAEFEEWERERIANYDPEEERVKAEAELKEGS